jgi:hypothetical protein
VLLPLTAEWREARDRKRKAIEFLTALRREPGEADVKWLSEVAARDDQDHARWELRYARLALGVLAARRDALDDRTGSEVAAALGEVLAGDPSVDPLMLDLVRRQLNDRLAGYNEALIAKGGPAGSGERLGRVLLAFASDGARSAGAPLPRAVELLRSYMVEANEALRTAYGAAELPEHLPPSEAAAR